MLKLNSMTNFQTFTDKMILSTSKDEKKILLWDENTCSVVYSYEDSNLRSSIAKDKLLVIGKDLYSEYILALQENKSLISVWKTNAAECAFKSSPVDERVTSVEVNASNKLMFIATDSGNLYIYELFSGNFLNSLQVSSSKILQIKTFLYDAGLILILCEDYIKIFKIEDLLEKNADMIKTVSELPNYDQFNKIIHIIELNSLIFYSESKNKIILSDFPSLKVIKSVYILNETYLISNITHSLFELFISFNSANVFTLDIKEILNHDQTIINLKAHENIFPVLQCESQITTLAISSKNIITGLEDGKIILWNKYTYKQENTFSLHKGAVTNLVLANRPISQYGLNFNSSIEETIVKPFKKPSNEYNFNIPVKNSVKNTNYVDKFLDDSLFEYVSNYDTNYKSKNKPIEVSTQNFGAKTIINSLNNAKSKSNLEDPSFLKKKLGEVYNMINNNY